MRASPRIPRRHASTRIPSPRDVGRGGFGGGRAVLAFFCVWSCTFGVALADRDDAADRLERVESLLREAQIEEAEQLLGPIAAAHPDAPRVAMSLAMVAFHRGDYERALAAMDRAIAGAPADSVPEDWRTLRGLVAGSREVTRGFVEERSADGRFVVSFAPGIDRVLVPYALTGLAAAHDAMHEVLAFRPPGPVRLEILPDTSALARVSTLTVAEIERTGTIALCKWDRLMVTSPRALVRGYPWLDTIAHEYVHLVVTRMTRDRAPVWLQEGLAKMLERRWRARLSGRASDGAEQIEPSVHALLLEAARARTLLPFERLHPSIARLPSQRDAALAFAQVYSFVRYLHGERGDAGLRAALADVRDGADAREAVADVMSTSFGALHQRWVAALLALPTPPRERPTYLGMRFRHGDGRVDESRDVGVTGARRFVRIGDLLWERRRARAAAVEYGRAHALAPRDPIVASRFAIAALESGDPASAARALGPMAIEQPEHAPTRAVLGAALARSGDRTGALPHLVEAIRLNPFDPMPHCELAELAASPADSARERDACRLLSSPGR